MNAPLTPANIDPKEHAALTRLLDIATGGSERGRGISDFLLPWRNSGTLGSLNIIADWAFDATIAQDIVTVFGLAARCRAHPDALGYEESFKRVARSRNMELTGRG